MQSKQIRDFAQWVSKACLSEACGRTQIHGKLQTAARTLRIIVYVEKQDEERQIYILCAYAIEQRVKQRK